VSCGFLNRVCSVAALLCSGNFTVMCLSYQSHKPMNCMVGQNEKVDPEKLRKDREELERRQKEG
jgi:hypothetical protein